VEDTRDFDSTTVRGKLLIEPKAVPGFSTTLTVSHTDVSGPQGEEVARPFGAHVIAFPAMPMFNPRTTSGVAETTWKLNDRLTVENTASYTDLLVKRFAPVGEGIAKIDGYEVLEEPRLKFGSVDGTVKGIAGIYLFHSSQDEFIDFGGNNNYDDRTTTVAAYGEATIGILEDVDLTLGARVEQEHRRRLGGLDPLFDVDFDETYRVFLPKAGLAWHATKDLTVGGIVSRGYNGGGAGITLDAPFVSYAYEPEYAWNYELYLRQDLFDRELSLTGNVFYSDYKDMQLPFNFPGTFSTIILNADRAVTYGAEVGATWRAVPGLDVFGDVGLLKTEIESFSGSPTLVGNDLPQSPAFTFDVGAAYRHSSGLDVGMDARFSDAYYSTIDNNPRGKTDPYWTVNAQVGYNFNENLRLFAFVNNIFDSDEPLRISPGATAADDVASIQHPRTFGIGIQGWF
jgi:outer membrane receptor protein involved in Fe transport